MFVVQIVDLNISGGTTAPQNYLCECTNSENNARQVNPFLLQECLQRAGAWGVPKFNNDFWSDNTTCVNHIEQINKLKLCPEEQSGILSARMISVCCCCPKRSPKSQRYVYTKCILNTLNLIDISAIKDYRYLQYLDLSRNSLKSLTSLDPLRYLMYLDASYNELITVLDFKPPHYLTFVNFSHNIITEIPDLSDFWSITDLNLSHNQIVEIEGLQNLRFLTTLNLSYNFIQNLANLNNLRIQTLILCHNGIHMVDKNFDISTLNYIRKIDLSHNYLNSLKFIEKAENLESLNMSYNNISKLVEIYSLRKLRYLYKLRLVHNAVTTTRRYYEVCVRTVKPLIYLDDEKIDSEYWSTKRTEVDEHVTVACNNIKLMMLEEMSRPIVSECVMPYNQPPPRILVLVSVPGSGQEAVFEALCDQICGLVHGVIHTTRPKLEEETDGKYYYFVDRETFNKMVFDGQFLTLSEFLGHSYGIAFSELEKCVDRVLVVNTDLKTALMLKYRSLNPMLVLLLPRSEQVHRANLNILYEDTDTELSDTLDFDADKSFRNQSESQIIYDGELRKCLKPKLKPVLSLSGIVGKSDIDNFASDRNNFVDTRSVSFLAKRTSSDALKYAHIRKTIGNSLIDDHSQSVKLRESMSKRRVSFGRKLNSIAGEISAQSSSLSHLIDYLDDISDQPEMEENLHGGLPEESFEMFWDENVEDEEPTNRLEAFIRRIFAARNHLLELHWALPGLFLELMFTDDIADCVKRVQGLFKDNNHSFAPLDFSKDPCFNNITGTMIDQLLEDMKRISLSHDRSGEKKINPHICHSKYEECNPSSCSN